MGECPGGDGSNSDGWGSPACDNRDPVSRTRQPIVVVTRRILPPVLEHPYKVVVDVVTTFENKFSFETEMDSSWSLEEVNAVAKKRAKAECQQRFEEMRSYEIVQLVLT